MCKQIAEGNDNNKQYNFDDFSEMIQRLRSPFKKEYDGHMVTVTEADSAVMMEHSAFEAIVEKVLVDKKRPGENDDATTNKKQRTGGNATVNTVAGANGHVCLHRSDRRNSRLNKESIAKKLRGLNTEKINIEKTLNLLELRKKKCQSSASSSVASSAPEQPVETVETPQNYWEVHQSEPSEFGLFLRLFEPKCKKLSKPPEEQWSVIQSKILPKLSRPAVDAKEEEYRRRVQSIEEEQQELFSLSIDEVDDSSGGTGNDNSDATGQAEGESNI